MSSTAKSTRESRRVSVTALVSLAHQQQQEDIEDELSKGLSVCSRSLCGCLFFFFLVLLAEMEGSVGQKAMACLFSSGGGLAGHWCTQGASSVSLLCWASIAKDTNSICCQKKKKKNTAQKRLKLLKNKISAQSKKNFVLERDVRYLDQRIALLIQHRNAVDAEVQSSSALSSLAVPVVDS